jgi:hypothetical protein
MSENDSLRELAEAGEAVFGTDDEQLLALFEHRCWKGSWLFAAAATAVISLTHISPWWVAGVALLLGWGMNEWEARKIKSLITARKRLHPRFWWQH